jgi:REP-associated tyrosine transposase
MSRLRRLVLSDRYFFVTCNLCRNGPGAASLLTEKDFASLAAAIASTREAFRFLLTAWVFLPDHWHALIFPPFPLTISKVMKVIKSRSTYQINDDRKTTGALWQARFYERALRNIKEYHDSLAYIHFNPVKRGLVARPEQWRWSSIHSYGGPQEPPLEVDRVRLPSDLRARL